MGCTIGGWVGAPTVKENLLERNGKKEGKKKESVVPWCVLGVCLVQRFDLV